MVDLEQGWTLEHEDIVAAQVDLISGQNRAYRGHGAAVLGQIIAVDNAIGCIGIAPGATARVVSQWRDDGRHNTADAILDAARVMGPGDVLLIEAQAEYEGMPRLWPVEVEEAVFNAIRTVTSRGIVVVEAAGNGHNDLDEFRDLAGRRVLNINSPDYKDSGAILVGAASSTHPHHRLDFSNHGSRVDCFAWGENVDTCGDGDQGASTSAYIPDFGGTSSASPIVAGAALLLQSWRQRAGASPFSPATLRTLLSVSSINTASANPAIDRIGVMPDLRQIIERERSSPSPDSLRMNGVRVVPA